MKLVISYNNDIKKTFIKIGSAESKELTFEELLLITNSAIDNNETYELIFEGFNDNPDVEENYKKVFEDIFELKTDSEILDLKKQIEESEKKKKDSQLQE